MKEKDSHPEPEIDDGGNTIVDNQLENDETGCTGQKLPNELMALIVRFLKDDLSTLASVAQVNHDLYDFAIPSLYETVTINKKNVRQVGYGHSGRLGHGHTSPRRIRPGVLSRKDKATTFTRILILEDALSANLRPYTELTDVILSAACFAVPRGGHISAATVGSLTTRQSPPTPLRATIYIVPAAGSPIGRLLLDRTRWSRPVWFDIFDMPGDEGTWWWAYRSRSVIRIAPNGWFRSIRAHFRSDRATLAHILYQCLFCSPDPINPFEGRLYFCVTPEIRLLTGQLQGLETDPLDVARTAVYDALYIVSRRDHRHVGWSNEQKAAYYDSMLEFVAPGFQPPFPSDITSGQDE